MSPSWRFASSSCRSRNAQILHNNLLDIGFALSNAVHDGLVMSRCVDRSASGDRARTHPALLLRAELPLAETKFPLVLCHPDRDRAAAIRIRSDAAGHQAPLNGRWK